MAIFYESIPKSLVEWILAQKVFWVATAPLSGNGHVNVSPKGGEYFGVIDERTFWYQELSGSGIETVSHLHEPRNGRITVMFNAFEGGPKIIRLWGKGQKPLPNFHFAQGTRPGRVIERFSLQFDDFVAKHDVKTIPATRSIIIVDIHQVGGSCGFSVPLFNFVGFRNTLTEHFRKMDERYKAGKESDSMDRYWAYKNAWSVDGLPGLKRGVECGSKEKVEPLKKMVGPLAPLNGKYRSPNGLALEYVVLVALMSFVLGALMMLYGKDHVPFGLEKVHVGGLGNATGFSMDSLPLMGQLRR